MTRDEVIALARKCGGTFKPPFDYGEMPDRMILCFDTLERLVALIEAGALEKCAYLAQKMVQDSEDACALANAIRAMKAKP